MNKVEDLIKFIEYKIKLTEEFVGEPEPDWFNTHDYKSGYYKGCKHQATYAHGFLNDILRKLKDMQEIDNG